jgi:uncharacterized protein YjbI with pentapeptide repeats
MIRDPKARADVEDNFRKTVGQALGGIFVLLGAGLAYWGTFQTLQANRQASRDLLVSNQVSKGFEQFGSDNIRVRLGGIYALEGVMKTSEQYHQSVLEALCAFVRDRTRSETGEGPPATDVQAALTVIGRRAAGGREVVDLSGAHIQKADLFDANLANAYLNDADLADANLANANLSRAQLIGANLRGASLVRASLSHAPWRTPTSEEDLRTARVESDDAAAPGARRFRLVALHGANLHRADLTGADLQDADLRVTDLFDANLTGANLDNADLTGASLLAATLTGAKLWQANLRAANLHSANLEHSDLTDADLRGAVFIAQGQLDQACGTNAKLDPGLTLKPCSSPPAK